MPDDDLGLVRRRGRDRDVLAEENDANLDKIETAIAGRSPADHTHQFVSDEAGNALSSGPDGGVFLASVALGTGGAVSSVAGKTGAVTLAPGDVGAAAAEHIHTAATTGTPGFMAAADKTKLNGIATSATANSPDASLLSRANHTGAQAINTVTGLQAALDDKLPSGDVLPAIQDLSLSDADAAALGGAVARSIDALPSDKRLVLGNLRPPQGGRFIFVSDATPIEMGKGYVLVPIRDDGETIEMRAVRGRGAAFDPALIFDAVADVPAKPVVTTNFTLTYSEATQLVTFAVTTPPSSSPAILRYVVSVAGTDTRFIVPVASLPFSFDFNPVAFPTIWQWQVASWTAQITVHAENANGAGEESAPASITIAQSSTWFIGSGSWTYEEVRNGATNGASRVTVGDIGLPGAGWALRFYPGPLSFEGNRNTILSLGATAAIEPNSNVVTNLSQANGTITHGILVWFNDEENTLRPASAEKTFTVQGRIVAGLDYTVSPSINPVSGKYPIGSALSVAFTPVGNTLSHQYSWNVAGVEVGTGSTYTPVAADDTKTLTCSVTIRNESTTLTQTTPPVQITYAAPTVTSPIADLVLTQESGARYAIALPSVFAGSSLSYLLSSVSALAVGALDPAVGIDMSSAMALTAVSVTASNSGGSITDTFNLTITASGSASPPTAGTVGGSAGGSNDPVFTAYATDDLILAFVFTSASAVAISAPNIAALSGAYDWTAVPNTVAQLTSVSGGVFYRRAASAGADGLQGPWPANALVRYVAISGIDWTDPIGDSLGICAAGATNVDWPGLTLETANSIVVAGAAFASGVTSQRPDARPGGTEIAFNAGSGVRHSMVKSASPAASWAAAADVPNLPTPASTSGRSYAFAVEIRGTTAAAGITWPAALASNAIAVTEVTSTAEATANGFGGQAGRLKAVTTAVNMTPTTVSGSFQVVFEPFGGPIGTPSTASANMTASSTTYTSAGLPVGSEARPRAWYRFGSGSTAKYKLAWSGAPFTIQGLSSGPVVTDWPDLNYVGTAAGEARSYAQTNWDADNVNGQGNSSYCGSALAACAYASFAGNTATDAYVVSGIKGGRDTYGGPALRGGFSAQHDTGYLCAAVWAKLTPRVWAQFDSTWRASLDQFMKWALVAAIGTAREADSAFKGDMLGNTTNASTRGGNPNISSAPAANIAACCAYLGVSVAKAYLDSVVVATEEVAMRTSPWTNIAQSFSLPRLANAPTHAQIQAACRRGTRFGVAITDQLGMWEAEVIHAFSKVISEGYNSGAGIPSSLYAAYPSGAWATGRGRVPAANLAAIRGNPDFIAIKGTVGAIREMDSTDAGGLRLSASYSEWTHRLMALYTLVVLTSGTVDKTNARALALRPRILAGCNHMRLVGQYGWLSVAHIVQGGLPASPEATSQWQGGGDLSGWTFDSRATQFGLKWHHDYARIIGAIL